MSLVTRCPACATTFKVVRDQLRISDGWVRCGRCSEVFDATIDLQETPDPAQPAGPAEEPRHVDLPAPPESAAESAQDFASDHPELDELAETDFLDDEQEAPPRDAGKPPSPPPPSPLASVFPPPPSNARPFTDFAATDKLPFDGVVADEPWPDDEEQDEVLRMMEMEASRTAVRPPPPPPLSFPDIDLNLPPARPALRAAVPPAVAEDTGNAQLQKALRRARAKSAKIAKAKARSDKAAVAATPSAPMVLLASEPEPSVEIARRAPRWAAGMPEASSFWHRAGVRRSFWALAVLAMLLLAVQVLQQQRDLIAARQPSLRPALESLCRLTGCQVSALRQISDITIDGASFTREKSGEGAYRFSFTLRNAAAVPLAMPAVELSLLDTQERAVVRRVLTPSEFGAPQVLQARAERAASLPLSLSGPEVAALPPIAGYRVVAFYP